MVYVISDLHGFPHNSFIQLLGSSGFCDNDFLYILGDVIDRNKVIAAILVFLQKMSLELFSGKEQIMARYRADCITVGQEISVIAGETVRYGTAVSVDDEGALVVRFADGHTEAVCTGEVSVRGMYGYI